MQVGIEVGAMAAGDKGPDRFRGFDHVQQTNPVVRPHTGFQRYW
jgi:hypothetical protein